MERSDDGKAVIACKNCGQKIRVPKGTTGQVDNYTCPNKECGKGIKVTWAGNSAPEHPPDAVPKSSFKPKPIPQQSPVIAPVGKIRCLIGRRVGNIFQILAVSTVSSAQGDFYIKIRGKWHGYVIDPKLAFMVAPVWNWWSFSTRQMPFLMYDLDESTPMAYGPDKAQIQIMMHTAKKMHGEVLPSRTLGEIKKNEVYYQSRKAQGKPHSQFDLTAIMFIALAAGGGFFAGALFGPSMFHTIPAGTVTTVTVTTTTTPFTNSTMTNSTATIVITTTMTTTMTTTNSTTTETTETTETTTT